MIELKSKCMVINYINILIIMERDYEKTVYSILIITLFIGLGLIITEQLTKDRNVFKVPSGYHKEIIDLSDHTRSDELLFPESWSLRLL